MILPYGLDSTWFISRDSMGYIDGKSLYTGYFAAGFGMDPSGNVWWVPAIIAGKIAHKLYRTYRAYKKAKKLMRAGLKASQVACTTMYTTYKLACKGAKGCSKLDCPKVRAIKEAALKACIIGRKAFETANCCHIRQLYLREFKKPGRAKSIKEMNKRAKKCSKGHEGEIKKKEDILDLCKTTPVTHPPKGT